MDLLFWAFMEGFAIVIAAAAVADILCDFWLPPEF